MYNERNDSFSIKDLIVQILFIVLFVFILIWLFPTKDYVGKNNQNLNFDVLTNRIFNENLQTMKEAAISYYTTPRLPKNVNDVKKMTLRKMLEEKLLIAFRDANNNSCDLDKSYVEITKFEDEYILKVNLSCTDNDAYILVHLGCYNYCFTDVCENKDIPASQPIENKPTTEPENPEPVDPEPEKPEPVDPEPENPEPENPEPVDPEPEKPEPEKTCQYKYEKVVTNYVWSAWSNWSTKVEKASATKEVKTENRTKTETKEVTKYRDVTYEDKSKPIIENVLVQNGKPITVTYCSSYKSQYTSTNQKKYEWIDQGTKYYSTHPKDGEVGGVTYKYEYVGSTTVDCGNCANGILYIYRQYKLKIYDVVTKEQICNSWATQSAPVFMIQPKLIGYGTSTRKEAYTDVETIKTTVTYYKYRTRSTTSNTLTKWSSFKNDKTLTSQGYKYVSSKCK